MQGLGKAIKDRRTKLGKTADALAREVALTITPQFDRESGKVSMPVEDLVRYAAALNCLPSDLAREGEQAIEPPLGSPATASAPKRKKTSGE